MGKHVVGPDPDQYFYRIPSFQGRARHAAQNPSQVLVRLTTPTVRKSESAALAHFIYLKFEF